MPQFDTSLFISQLFWLSFSFVLLYSLVSRYIAPLIKGILSQRNKVLQDNISEAQNYSEEIKLIETDLKSSEIELDQVIEEMYQASRQEIEAIYQTRKKEIEEKIHRHHQKSAQEIENYAKDFRDNQKKYQIKIASLIIEKITQKPASEKTMQEIAMTNNT
jgi:F-type H+-transporting ATPase subunit b